MVAEYTPPSAANDRSVIDMLYIDGLNGALRVMCEVYQVHYKPIDFNKITEAVRSKLEKGEK